MRIKTAQTEYAVIDSAGTCVDSWEHKPDFNVAKVVYDKAWQFPGLIVGYVPTGEPTCASVRDTCFTFPVQVKHDGTPAVSFGSWISAGYEGNESLDIWFSPVKSRHSIAEKAGDTEIMVWTDLGGSNGGHRYAAYATIDRMRFGIMSWVAGGPHRYVAYVWLNANGSGRGHKVSVRNLWLNPFFRNAVSHGWLRADEWWWSLAIGFEMNRGGAANNVHAVDLKGFRSSGPR